MDFEDLIALVRRLPVESKERLLAALIQEVGHQVRDAGEAYDSARQDELTAMKSITLVLPDELASQAQAAGLLAGTNLETLIRRALQEQGVLPTDGSRGTRRLILRDGRLVIEALPAEQPITSAEAQDALHKMEW